MLCNLYLSRSLPISFPSMTKSTAKKLKHHAKADVIDFFALRSLVISRLGFLENHFRFYSSFSTKSQWLKAYHNLIRYPSLNPSLLPWQVAFEFSFMIPHSEVYLVYCSFQFPMTLPMRIFNKQNWLSSMNNDLNFEQNDYTLEDLCDKLLHE